MTPTAREIRNDAVESIIRDLRSAHLATPTEPPPSCGNCDGNLEERICEYCLTNGCKSCMAQCPECQRWVCLEPSRDCALLNIDGTEMCLHCAADHVKQLASTAKVKLPVLSDYYAGLLRSAITDLALIHDDTNAGSLLAEAKRDFPSDHARVYPSAFGRASAVARWTAQRLAFAARELGVIL